MLLTIIPSDKTVYKNGSSISELELSGIPGNVHALQWHATSGWIEYSDGTPNEPIEALPQWALDAESAYQVALVIASPENNQPPTLSFDQKLDIVRFERNKRVAATDWTQAGDVIRAHTPEWTQAWEAYRQALRDLPSTITADNIDTFAYPTPPEV